MPPIPIWQEDWWTPEPVWTKRRREYSSPYRDSNFDSSVFQPVTSLHTDYSIPFPVKYYTFKIMEKVFKIVIGLWLDTRTLLLFLKTDITAASFHKVGNSPLNKLMLKIRFQKGTKISGQILMIKLRISFERRHFDERKHGIFCLISELEIEETF
jgi:hypothetical protein